MRYVIAIALLLTACGDEAPPVPDDVLDTYHGEAVECLVDDDCTDSGRFGERFCVECVCVSDRTHFAPCWKLGGDE